MWVTASTEHWRFPNNVAGWLTENEGRALADEATGRLVLELGSYCGRSTICMAQVARMVHAVDWHRGDRHIGQQNTLPLLVRNLHVWHLQDKVIIHVGAIDDVAVVLAESVFDFVLVDSAHDYQRVCCDLTCALKSLKTSGTIAVHDVDYTDVQRACLEYLQEPTRVVDRLGLWER